MRVAVRLWMSAQKVQVFAWEVAAAKTGGRVQIDLFPSSQLGSAREMMTQVIDANLDFIIEGLIVVEIKAVSRLDQVHRAQLISYLKTTGLHGGLLINFRVPLLKDGIRRLVA